MSPFISTRTVKRPRKRRNSSHTIASFKRMCSLISILTRYSRKWVGKDLGGARKCRSNTKCWFTFNTFLVLLPYIKQQSLLVPIRSSAPSAPVRGPPARLKKRWSHHSAARTFGIKFISSTHHPMWHVVYVCDCLRKICLGKRKKTENKNACTPFRLRCGSNHRPALHHY